MMQGKYNQWSPWGKLKTCMLGSFYPPEFFNAIEEDSIRTCMQRISEETLEDLENFHKVLLDFGVDVHRTQTNPNDSIDRYIIDGEVNYINPFNRVRTVPRPPLQCRDSARVIGDKLYITHGDHADIFRVLDNYNKKDQVILDFELDNLDQEQKDKLYEVYYYTRRTKDWPPLEEIHSYTFHLDPMTQMEIEYFRKYARQSMVHLLKAPCITLVGKDLYLEGALFDLIEFKNIDFGTDLRFNIVNMGGHSDGCFAPLKPGALMVVQDTSLYEESFPNWDICHLPNSSKSSPMAAFFHESKAWIGGRWYVDGKINPEFIAFVDKYMVECTGFTMETNFDVNCLVLDENHVVVSNLIPKVAEFFKKHKIEPIVVPFRHRHFHDGGLHCITLDLYREEDKVDYFPERTSPVDNHTTFEKIRRGFKWNLKNG